MIISKLDRRRVLLAGAVALCVVSSSACIDPPATFLPRSGSWIYDSGSEVSDNCPVEIEPLDLETYILDYDEGDAFQIELGANDVTCEIDRESFTCSDFVLYEAQDPELDSFIRVTLTWEGDFSSETAMSGNEIVSATCTGEDCGLIPMIPCTRTVKFGSDFIN